MWFIFALVCLLGWGTADLFYKKSSDENDRYSHLKIAVWVGIVMGVCAFGFLPFAEHGVGVLNISNLLKYSPASLGYIFSMVIGYAGLRYMEVSIISPVQNTSGALSAIVMTLWFLATAEDKLGAISDETGLTFGEKSGLELFNNILILGGVAIICVGVVLLGVIEQKLSLKERSDISAGLEKPEDRKHRLGLLAFVFPILYCLFDTIGTAADGIILDEESGIGLGEIDVIVIYGLTFFLAGIVSWIFLWIKEKKPYNPFTKHEIATKGAAACFEEFGQIFYVYAMADNGVIAAPMIAAYCIVSVILSRIFLKEKLHKNQYIAVAIVIIGIISLGISDGISLL